MKMVKLANTVHLISVFLCVLFFGEEKKLIKIIAPNSFALCDSALAFRQSALFTEVPKGLPIAKREAVYEKPRGIFVNEPQIYAVGNSKNKILNLK